MRLFLSGIMSLFIASGAFANVDASSKQSYECELSGIYVPTGKVDSEYFNEKAVVEIETPVFTDDQVTPDGRCAPKGNTGKIDVQGIIFELDVLVCRDPIPYYILTTKIPGKGGYSVIDIGTKGVDTEVHVGLEKKGGIRLRDGLADGWLRMTCKI
jgi:hypothetical protein